MVVIRHANTEQYIIIIRFSITIALIAQEPLENKRLGIIISYKRQLVYKIVHAQKSRPACELKLSIHCTQIFVN